MPLTAKDRAWKVLNAIPDPSDKADAREYVIYLEGQLAEVKRNYARLRDPRHGNY